MSITAVQICADTDKNVLVLDTHGRVWIARRINEDKTVEWEWDRITLPEEPI